MAMKKKQIAITLGIMCFVLTISIGIQYRTIKGANTIISQSLEENGLRDEVLKWKERYDKALESLNYETEQLEKIRELATQDNKSASIKQEEIKLNNILLGMTDVTGPGVEITLSDNKESTDGIGILNPSLVVVHADDLREVINALKNAGAEAISINGERIVATTAITCEGNVTKINGEKVGSPFVIKAIGSPELLETSLTMPGGYLEIMKEQGTKVSVEKMENLQIPKYNGVFSNKYIKTDK